MRRQMSSGMMRGGLGVAALAAGALLAGPARAELSCSPILMASKDPVTIRLCVDALDERMIVLNNEHPALDALPVIPGCALSFADGRKKIVRWAPRKIPARGERRERAPLAGLPEPISAVCEIERVALSSDEAADNEPERTPPVLEMTVSPDAGEPRGLARGAKLKKPAPRLMIRPSLHPEFKMSGGEE